MAGFRFTNREIVAAIAYTLAIAKVSVGTVYILFYLISDRPEDSSRAHEYESMTFDSAISFAIGGASILMVLWLVSSNAGCPENKNAELRKVNNRLAEQLTESLQVPDKKTE